MKDLKHLFYLEGQLQTAHNDLIRRAKEDGGVCVAYTCENVPEPLLNLGDCFSIRLSAPGTGSMDIATYYMTNMLCETSRALLERAIEGGFNFADALVTPDGCTMMNRAMENVELLHAMGQGNDHFFLQFMEIPLKSDENNVELLKLQSENHILRPLRENYGIDTSDEAIRAAVREHNHLCELIRAIGEYRKSLQPVITGYEFHVLTLASYVCPKKEIIPILEETLEELKVREPDDRKWRARLVIAGSEVDDSGYIKLAEECGAYVCADRFCFGSFPGRMPIELTEEEDALTQVCRHYTYGCQCARMMNQDKVYARKKYVADLAREYHADGVIYEQMKFCDPWAYERVLGSQILRDEYHIPVLSVDRPYNIASSAGQMRTRIQAFVENIEIKKIKAEQEGV